MAKVDAVIIAGGTIGSPELRAAAGVDCKSLILIHGKPMAYWVVKALRDTACIGSVVVVGNRCLAEAAVSEIADHVLTEESHEVENLIKGVDALDNPERILMVSGDTPLLTPDCVADLVQNAPDADVVFPTVEKTAVVTAFPDKRWMFARTTEGEFTGSSSVVFRPEVFREHKETVIKVFNARRSAADLVALWGASFAFKFALGRLSIADMEEHISKTMGIDARSYVSRYAELAFDVDRASDIVLAEERLRNG